MKIHVGNCFQTRRNCSWCFEEVMCRLCASCKEPFRGGCYHHTPCCDGTTFEGRGGGQQQKRDSKDEYARLDKVLLEAKDTFDLEGGKLGALYRVEMTNWIESLTMCIYNNVR